MRMRRVTHSFRFTAFGFVAVLHCTAYGDLGIQCVGGVCSVGDTMSAQS